MFLFYAYDLDLQNYYIVSDGLSIRRYDAFGS